MPAPGLPEYNPATNQLTIPAVGVAANRFAFNKDFVTNALITISKVISVGGTAARVPDAVGATRVDATTAVTEPALPSALRRRSPVAPLLPESSLTIPGRRHVGRQRIRG